MDMDEKSEEDEELGYEDHILDHRTSALSTTTLDDEDIDHILK